MVLYALSSTSSLPLFSRVKFFRMADSISLDPRKLLLQAYKNPVVIVFLNTAFLLFCAPGTGSCGNQIHGGQGSLSPGFFREATLILLPGVAISWLGLHVPYQPFGRFLTPCLP